MGPWKKDRDVCFKSGEGMVVDKPESLPGEPVRDIHDTYWVNDHGEISGGHTTVVTDDGKKVHLSWEDD